MAIYRIGFVSTPSGEFAAAWVDDERFLWADERLERETPLLPGWTAPRLRLARPDRGATDVLFNPNAVAVSERVRTALDNFNELELLPLEVSGVGTYYVVHSVTALDAPLACSLRRSPPPGGNIVEIFGFPRIFETELAFFRIRHPADSAGGRGRFCFRTLFATSRGARAISQSCAGYLEATEVISGD